MAGTVKLDEYFRTTFEDKLLVKMPEREDDHITPATRLMEKRREMSEVEHALSAQKEEFQMKMESLQQRRAELERKEYQLKESLLKFDKFLKENDSKRTRAIKKANYERDLKKSKDREIIRLNEEITALTKQKVHLLRKLNSYTIYQNFMAKVLEAGEEFHETRDIIARYDTLAATYQDLVETEQKNQDLIEKLRQELMYYSEEKQNEILSYNNKLSTLQIRLDTALSGALKWESKWNRIKNTASKKTLVLGKIKMATHNLYHLVKKHQKQPADSEDTMEQLEQILLFSQDLNNITEEIKHLELAEASLTLPPSR